MKKRVLIYALRMTVGGVEKALLGQLTQFPKEEYEVTLVFQNKIGGYLQMLPKYVKIVEHEQWKTVRDLVQNPLHINAVSALKKGRLLKCFHLILLYVKAKMVGSYKPLHDYVQTLLSDYPGEFDLAIDYAGPTSFSSYFVAKHVHAKEKWSWIHFDIDRFGIDKKVAESIYGFYDKINIVSREGKEHFDRVFPQFSNRSYVFYNILDQESILMQANAISNPYAELNAKTIICTVGRISPEKGQLITIKTLKILLDRGHDVHWCYVGDGADMQKCQALADEYGIAEFITFAGMQTNPYPWMKHCTLYMQPSVHEGFCITLAEAKIFAKPIVTTNFTGAKEQLIEYVSVHKIVEHDAISIADGIESILEAE